MLEDLTWSKDIKKHKEPYPKNPIPIPYGLPFSPFSKENKDIYGMPQPTFYFRTSEKNAEINHEMLNDMTQAALSMGASYLVMNLSLRQQGTACILYYAITANPSIALAIKSANDIIKKLNEGALTFDPEIC
ncbi:pyranose 2-oxidase [Gigaspora margarita]|uniref:Pyranose 2-oxidase n=1 Tax=Gigaspora margarita TaxID=4874 RepID=A0A8H3XFV6_GIGMA|nr:pyranose 2-oxidase [Gigaspora margarita]